MDKFNPQQVWTIDPGSKNTWQNITREERYYCALLFEYIKKDTAYFVDWLNRYINIKLDKNLKWEVGYEVCFYRDWFKSKGQSARKLEFPMKRTFDLCLFSKNNIVIIEAKAQQAFKKADFDLLIQDRETINNLFNRDYKQVSVNLVALASSKWINKKIRSVKPVDTMITWREVANLYCNQIFNKADDLYGQ